MRAKIFILFTALAMGIGYLIFSLGESNKNKKFEFKYPDQVATQKKEIKNVNSSALRVVASSSVKPSIDPREVTEDLKGLYGPGLALQFSSNGTFESATGNLAQGLSQVKDFSPRSEQQVRERAADVMKEIVNRLGASVAPTMNEPLVTLGDHSATVYFVQNFEGVPFEPSGRITVDLGPHGELLGVYSDLVSNYEVSGEFRASPPSSNSSKVYWIDTSVTPPRAVAAYQTYENGKQVITSATDGKVLFKRDRRIF